jgi:hypothetical protein
VYTLVAHDLAHGRGHFTAHILVCFPLFSLLSLPSGHTPSSTFPNASLVPLPCNLVVALCICSCSSDEWWQLSGLAISLRTTARCRSPQLWCTTHSHKPEVVAGQQQQPPRRQWNGPVGSSATDDAPNASDTNANKVGLHYSSSLCCPTVVDGLQNDTLHLLRVVVLPAKPWESHGRVRTPCRCFVVLLKVRVAQQPECPIDWEH